MFDYYSKTASKKVAHKIRRQILSSTKRLNKNPEMGQMEFYLEKLKENHRYILSGNYKVIYSVMANNKEFTELNILTKNDEIYNNYLTLQSDNTYIKFYFHIRAILMGEDDGNDVLINLVDFIKMLNSTIPERMK
jgi:plasmid stabilization system protein ParE